MNRVLTVPRAQRSRTSVRLAVLCAVLAFALSLVLAPISSADPGGDKKALDAHIARLRTALDGTSQKLAQASARLQRTKAALPGARRAMAAAVSAQDVADRRNEAVATALALAEANADKIRDALAQNARDTQKVQDELGNLARDEYQQGGVSGLSIALEATSPADFTNRMIMMDTVMRIRGQRLRGLDTVRAQGQAAQAHLVAVRQQVSGLKVQAEAALAQATAARKAAADAKSRLDLMYADQIRDTATVSAERASEIASIKKMQAQSDLLTRQLAARARAAREAAGRGSRQSASNSAQLRSAQPGSGTGFLSYPSNGGVSSEFGMRFHPVLRISRLHAGIDFAASCGSPVYAAAPGTVIMTTPVGQSGGYGNRLVIDHGIQRGVDLTTTYNHLTSFAVTSGRVARGQVVAYSGTTGLSTGCHLHFETREDGTPVNPRLWF
ncbi:MAG TPA: M23 family metallopeptidase [Dermatophilaceae bacterium]|nr:M23 family metallopeptidase [Dermatophilaceae bacterium]